MKTIEERALRYIETQCKGCRNEDKKGRYVGFIQGATEQKVIDDAELAEVKRQRDAYYDELLKLRQQKEKACEWLKANADKYIVDIGIRDVNLIVGDMCWVDFRKAMEE